MESSAATATRTSRLEGAERRTTTAAESTSPATAGSAIVSSKTEIVGEGSSSRMTPRPVLWVMPAPEALSSLTVKSSEASSSKASANTCIGRSLLVSPMAKVSVPVVSERSLPTVALPETVWNMTVTGTALGVESFTWKTTSESFFGSLKDPTLSMESVGLPVASSMRPRPRVSPTPASTRLVSFTKKSSTPSPATASTLVVTARGMEEDMAGIVSDLPTTAT